jgi:hypothetical protein
MTSGHVQGSPNLNQFLHNLVRIETLRGTVLHGGVVSIDPVSNTAILLSFPLKGDRQSVATSELLLVPAVDWTRHGPNVYKDTKTLNVAFS